MLWCAMRALDLGCGLRKYRAMTRLALVPLLIAAAPAPETPKPIPSPPEIVAAAPAADWVTIAPADLLVMDLTADAKGRDRRVVIQLMPAPFSQGWVGNIRRLVAARWYDGISVNRVQDNYVVQWGDASEKKALPAGLLTVPEGEYAPQIAKATMIVPKCLPTSPEPAVRSHATPDGYARSTGFVQGWPIGLDGAAPGPRCAGKKLQRLEARTYWPTHCYGMVGVGRDMPPNTGAGAELYTVIGHAPRHLDRNIALVGRVIEGIEHLSSLPRGTGPLGFYETAEERVPILSIRIGTEIAGLPRFEYLSTESESFARYADARANRRDAFFIKPAGGADVCNIPVPVRRAK
jgi:cyclophilin family peptidyl-prolyl cis-trans isomerase